MDDWWHAQRRIAVDLDGTILATDLLWESALRYVVSHPLAVFRLLRWLARGRAYAKTRLAEHVDIDVGALPYKQHVVDRLVDARHRGTELILATAASEIYARRVADHLGVFTAVIATGPSVGNLRSEAKSAEIARVFGGRPWAYVGDSAADLPVWRDASAIATVDARPRVRGAAEKLGRLTLHLRGTRRRSRGKAWMQQLRVHQWSKNLLVFVPLLASHSWNDIVAVAAATTAFLAFNLTASAVYVANDLADLDADRAHRVKRQRPLAAGELSIPAAIAVAVGLGLGALALAWVCGLVFLLSLAIYAGVTTAYTVALKRRVVADVVTLALLYTWRIVAGAVAIAVLPSIWLLAFSTFIFLSLALMKRYAEIANHERDAQGRGYVAGDAPLLLSAGPASGLIGVLVLVLYLDSSQVREHYDPAYALWPLVPLVIYWLLRAWILAARRQMDDDPVIWAFKDRASRWVAAMCTVVVVVATLV